MTTPIYQIETEKSNRTITVKVDDANAAKMLQEERKEKEALQKQVDDFKKAEYERRKNALPSKYRDSVTPESIEAIEQIAQEEIESNRKGADGTVPLSGQNLRERKPEAFQDVETMIKTLREREAKGDKLAHTQLSELFKKTKNQLGTFQTEESPIKVAQEPKRVVK